MYRPLDGTQQVSAVAGRGCVLVFPALVSRPGTAWGGVQRTMAFLLSLLQSRVSLFGFVFVDVRAG
jgi:hypothetical protein